MRRAVKWAGRQVTSRHQSQSRQGLRPPHMPTDFSRAGRRAFLISKKKVIMPTKHNAAIALIGTGLVGTELVTQLAAQAKTLTSLKLVGVTSSSKMVLNSDNLLVQPVQSLVDQLKGPSAAPVGTAGPHSLLLD